MNELDKRKLFNAQRRQVNRLYDMQLAYSTVGTPDYIAPEVFTQKGYTETVDWWSVGVIFFEMIVGYPPFFADEPSVTCQKIIHWKRTFSIPEDANLSSVAADLIRRLICDAEHRLGNNGAKEIKSHPFFKGLDWEMLRISIPPFIPDLSSDVDTTNFDKFEEDKAEPFYPSSDVKSSSRIVFIVQKLQDAYFPGYTFKQEVEIEKNMLYKKAGNDLSAIVKEKKQLLNNIESNMEQKAKENCQSFSTKHSTQQCLFPLQNESQNALLKNSVMGSSKRKIQPSTKLGFRKDVGRPIEACGLKNEPLKIKLVPGTRGDSREGKRNTSSIRKFK